MALYGHTFEIDRDQLMIDCHTFEIDRDRVAIDAVTLAMSAGALPT
ncbi:hypothetical protein [Stenomitos frigidus]|nr:hypothetical protein [Stenomitos frigidus]